jgi:hypothetical protein
MNKGDADGIAEYLRDGFVLREGYLNRIRVKAGLEPVDWSISGDLSHCYSTVPPPYDRC